MNSAAKSLNQALLPHLQSRGFKAKTGFDGIVHRRKQNFGFVELTIAFFHMQIDGGHTFFNPVLSVRHDRVENVVNQLGHIWGDANQKNTSTVSRGLQFFPFDIERDCPQIIRDSDRDGDTAIALKNILSMLDEHGFAFFDRYSSLDECAVDLNDPIGKETHPLCNLMPLRAYYGTAAAALSGSVSVAGLLQQYVDYIRDRGLVDPLRYTSGKDESGIAHIERRLNKVAALALAAS